MIRLLLLRHGNTFEEGQTPTQVGARSDLPLTLQGCEQAKNFSCYLLSNKIEPKAIFAGKLQRQQKTAQIIQESLRLNTSFLYEPALTEIDYGAWEGLSSEEISSRWPEEYANWTHAGAWPEKIFPQPLEKHIADIKSWLEILRKTCAPQDTIVAVTSNGLMRLFYSLLEPQWNTLVQNRQIESIKVKTGNFCSLLLLENSIEVDAWNAKPIPSFEQPLVRG